jgi:hypothetical protein
MERRYMTSWNDDTILIIPMPPDSEVLHLSDLDAGLAANACADPSCLLGQGRLPLAPPCGHRQAIKTWHAQGRLWLWCARCHVRLSVAVRGGIVEQPGDETATAEASTTLCGHAPDALVLYTDGWVQVSCLECQVRWSAWQVAAYVPEVPA